MASGLLTRSAKSPSAQPKSSARPKSAAPPRWSAIDGVRALAVAGVMLYHAGVSWIPGGLLGVDVFFVLSGYLITSLLLREVREGGWVKLGAFWMRRARRLLPALLLVLIAVMIWAGLDKSQDISSVRIDVASALGYVANWRFAFSHQGYFASAQTPSPVLHLWSLGVEEQFYLVWPLLVVGAVALSRLRITRQPREKVATGRVAVFVLALVGTAASTTWLVMGALDGVDASRLYYGTDTRALALLTGGMLAALMPLPRSPASVRPKIRAVRWWSLVGVLAFGSLIAVFGTVNGQDRLLYRGGFLVVAVLVALVLAALIKAPRGPLARLLSIAPLPHIGRISYALYLWHWPVILFLTGARTGLHGVSLLALRLGVSLVLAELSYAMVERPVLSGLVPGRKLATAALITVVGLVCVSGPWSALPRDGSNESRASFASTLDTDAQKQEQNSNLLTHERVTGVKPTPTPAPTPTPSKPVVSGTPQKLPGGAPAVVPNPLPAEPINVLVVGDSTAFTAAQAVESRAAAWKVNLIDGARIGCGIAPGVGAGPGDQAPVKYGECWNWPQLWSQTVAVQRPDLSLVVLGHWETVDRNVNGTVMHIGEPVYDKLLKAEFEKAVAVLGSQGGKVGLATAPCYLRPERPDGTRWPQDDCRRVQAFNRLVWSVAQEHPKNVVVLDLYQFFSPDGKWHLDIGGHQVRDVDGIHFDVDAGEDLAPVFLGGVRTLLGLPLLPLPPPAVHLAASNGG